MLNKLVRILVGIAIVGGLLWAAYTFLPLNLTGGVRQWIQETFHSDLKPVADAARDAEVYTVDPLTKKMVKSGITYKELIEKNCDSVSWYVTESGDGWDVECNGYKVTIQVDDLVTPNNSKTWTDAHLTMVCRVERDTYGNYKLTNIRMFINDDPELSADYVNLVIDDLLSKVNP
jgi:hypothetical protein